MSAMPGVNRPSFAEVYERELVGPLFRPWVETLLQLIRLAPGDRLLDVACGTGVVARAARERLGDDARVVAVDLSPLMIAHARALAPEIDFREGSADALPIRDDERFDVVTCQQGLQFFADRPKAAAEFRRALEPCGRIAIATWRPVAELPLIAELQAIGERHVGAIHDARHAYGETAPLEELLVAAGFSDVRVTTHTRTIRFADAMAFPRLNAMAIVGMSAAGKSMSDEQRAQAAAAIAADSAGVMSRYADGAGIAFELGTNIATARA